MMSANQTTYRPAGRVVTRRIGEDNLLVPISGGSPGENAVFPVNDTGLFAWERLSTGKTIEETARDMSEVFDVETEAARTDCAELVQTLTEQKLLEVVTQ